MIKNKQRHIELTLPVHVVERELKIYNAREQKEIRPCNFTWPSFRPRFSTTKKRQVKYLTKFIIKFKRRERWEMFKAEHRVWIDLIHERSQNIPKALESFHVNGNGAPNKMVMHFTH